MKIDFKQRLKQINIEIVIFTGIMAIIYCVRLFTNGPWYDELYTYYSFISRGPIYAAIHWPVPNNHVGYSVLSGCFMIFGNSYIALRGVAFLAAITNLVLIYHLTLKLSERSSTGLKCRALALSASVLFAGAWIVQNLSVQGRGYSLAITCFLISLECLRRICLEEATNRYYVLFAASLTLGLYIIMSSIYWVLPVCLVGGFYLLSKKNYQTMWKLIRTALWAAAAVIFLYGLIWLAIGANLLCKNPDSGLYGLHQITVILKAPFKSAKTGIDYMLATPYIQSIDRKTATLGMPGYFRDFFDQCYSGFGVALVVIMLLIITISAIMAVRSYRIDGEYLKWLVILGTLLGLVGMLLVQSVHPYKRVCCFIFAPMCMGIIFLIDGILARIKDRLSVIVAAVLAIAAFTYVMFRMTTYDFTAPLADRENDIRAALDVMEAEGRPVASINTAYYTDDYQKYVLKFYYDAEPAEVSLEDADMVMTSPEMLNPEYQEYLWPMLTAYDLDMLKYIEDNFRTSYSSDTGEDSYTVYIR